MSEDLQFCARWKKQVSFSPPAFPSTMASFSLITFTNIIHPEMREKILVLFIKHENVYAVSSNIHSMDYYSCILFISDFERDSIELVIRGFETNASYKSNRITMQCIGKAKKYEQICSQQDEPTKFCKKICPCSWANLALVTIYQCSESISLELRG